MSLTLSLVSAAVIAGVSLATTTTTMLINNISDKNEVQEGINTMFVDSDILCSTLNELGACINKISENEFSVATQCGNIRYARENASQAFKIYFDEINDVEALMEQLKTFELDYGRNVQAYTYNHLKENLTDDMLVADEQVLDDDSLLLTINIE